MFSGDKVTEFTRGSLVVKIKEDLKGLRIFNKDDLKSIAYYHSRRFFLPLPGWILRVNPEFHGQKPDLAVLENYETRAILQFEFALAPQQYRYFPKVMFDERMVMLKNSVKLSKNKGTKAYLFGIYDTDESIFYPTIKDKDFQSTLWIPINVREFQDYSVWRKKWDEMKSHLF